MKIDNFSDIFSNRTGLAKFLDEFSYNIKTLLAKDHKITHIIANEKTNDSLSILKHSYLISDRTVLMANCSLVVERRESNAPFADIPDIRYQLKGESEFKRLLRMLEKPIIQNQVLVLPKKIINIARPDIITPKRSWVSESEKETVKVFLEPEGIEVSGLSGSNRQWDALLKQAANLPQTDFNEFLYMDLPYLNEAPFELLNNLRRDYEDSFEDFRSDLKKAIIKYRETFVGTEEKHLRKRAAEIRTDIIEPACRRLERQYRRIVRYRSVRLITGGIIGTIPVVLQILGISYYQILATVVGVTSLGAIGKETSDFLQDFDRMKDQSMYFIWKLKHSRMIQK